MAQVCTEPGFASNLASSSAQLELTDSVEHFFRQKQFMYYICVYMLNNADLF